MYNLRILLTNVFLFIGMIASAQDNYFPMRDIDSFRQQLESMTNAVQTIESDFVQEKMLNVLSSTIVSRGSFCFRKESNIRWEYTEPYQYLIILNGSSIYIREESGQKQYDVQSNKMFQEMNRFISGCIQGDILKDDQEYKIEYLENDREYYVTLVPNSQALREMLNEVQITFDKNDLTVSRITMVESGGDYTRINFVNKKLNTDIPLEKFSFN